MVSHSECEISQSWRTQFSSHGAFNLNRAIVPPPPFPQVSLTCSNPPPLPFRHLCSFSSLGARISLGRDALALSPTLINYTIYSTISIAVYHIFLFPGLSFAWLINTFPTTCIVNHEIYGSTGIRKLVVKMEWALCPMLPLMLA